VTLRGATAGRRFLVVAAAVVPIAGILIAVLLPRRCLLQLGPCLPGQYCSFPQCFGAGTTLRIVIASIGVSTSGMLLLARRLLPSGTTARVAR